MGVHTRLSYEEILRKLISMIEENPNEKYIIMGICNAELVASVSKSITAAKRAVVKELVFGLYENDMDSLSGDLTKIAILPELKTITVFPIERINSLINLLSAASYLYDDYSQMLGSLREP